ncbi:related to Protein NIF3 homolog [Armillaria ostoyae]|uniref:Related to Protein NIF3 homolog n=1 Tax=Armillaria ostoyae TaxID=47428 RepID=A0A284RUR8_ARMOS|nr:related to Protein NIF3 homolog [Armillaria ostoyae]
MSIPFVKTVCRAMENIAPLRLAEKWDNVGLLLESPSHKLNGNNRVLLTNDLTSSVVEESIALNAPVIVSYHPPIFKPLQSLTLTNPLQASLLRCVAEGISVFSPHTSLDSAWGGVNDWLAKGLGTGKVSALVGEKLDASGTSEGAGGRLMVLDEPVSVKELVSRVKRHLVQVAYPFAVLSDIRTVAICAGSGGSMLVGRDADVYFTGEMSHHEVLASVAAGKHVVLCGHTNTERGYLSQTGCASADIRMMFMLGMQEEGRGCGCGDKEVAEDILVNFQLKFGYMPQVPAESDDLFSAKPILESLAAENNESSTTTSPPAITIKLPSRTAIIRMWTYLIYTTPDGCNKSVSD